MNPRHLLSLQLLMVIINKFYLQPRNVHAVLYIMYFFFISLILTTFCCPRSFVTPRFVNSILII
ncbi:hypothetical protein GLOIN_2v1538719 [Rhizophagus irregularis DAOM 181602=DAOM 197198]|uniref:Uncharacterized protein n=1 Tax=Rhizophagus irregularis (strain DAOM 181602 / DAOM 197198 / MUCL 43194) TaxID=747089 RepID=A0A2P4QL65_RHIID|nr:hypothetical protein GLOIN_2v1538719 [Rhizophagus irregularis DAOM 181602=DAOM 197198]POG78366.1 hypothetical protein GLOIN_2v1538719 [Rhizophagus irregularis DAOM 181602=DAOM 197198]|eukprot:XP_025185232.1 hypothetical protein GLOIN_2v1538719 [Rhizophagus irregularis DAOM 181602=DAOM 197198]